ncbi:glucose-1-phosphate adenylyltransferase family protein [Knoellia locipacati]|uniref:glucose-1-phosphate adenylyltransferase family protein n=1 Tax=Knoellia locipacati TaxID=882824 RepID=UPI0011BE5390|nr:sugar phosphate nucleotidyltransferase [Knoellia locipacati]
MSRRPRVLAIVQAGGKGSRMDVLTRERAKPALPYAGQYQLVDFALSSLAHSGISDVWLSVQYLATSLHKHVANGRPWDLDRTRGGLQWLPPEEGSGAVSQDGFSAGNADDLYRNLSSINDFGADVLLVLSADSVCSVDLRDVVDQHLDRGSSCTVVTAEVTRSQASAKGVVRLGRGGRVTGFDDKPEDPATTTVAAEIFAYDPARLTQALEDLRAERVDDADGEDSGLGDFGEHLLPRLVSDGDVHAFPLRGYWRDVGTPSEYVASHRDLLAGRVDVLDDPEWPILTRWPELPSARIRKGAVVEASVVSAGADVSGTVRRSVIGPGVRIGRGAVVEDSVIFARTTIEGGAEVRAAVVDSQCTIARGARVGEAPPGTRVGDDRIVLVGHESTVGRGVVVPPGARLEPGSTA